MEDPDYDIGEFLDGLHEQKTTGAIHAFKRVKDSLFASEECLAHCVSADFKMGAGIALQFRNKFGRVDQLLSQKQGVPGLGVLKVTNRFLYYLVTKEKYYQKPTLKNLAAAIKLMVRHATTNKVKTIAFPLLGCGLDKLRWADVEKILSDELGSVGIKGVLYET